MRKRCKKLQEINEKIRLIIVDFTYMYGEVKELDIDNKLTSEHP
jgi:hypothetical protein